MCSDWLTAILFRLGQASIFLKRLRRASGAASGNGGRCAGRIKAARANAGRIVATCGNLPAANTRYEGGLTSHRETRSFLSLCFGTRERSRWALYSLPEELDSRILGICCVALSFRKPEAPSLVIPQNNDTAMDRPVRMEDSP